MRMKYETKAPQLQPEALLYGKERIAEAPFKKFIDEQEKKTFEREQPKKVA